MRDADEIFALRPGRADDWTAVRAFLADAGLPVDDLDQASMVEFTIAGKASKEAETLVGVIALQAFDEVGLLRSLAVAKSARSAGCGSKLVEAIERIATQSGVSQLWLLTTDAEGYFKNRGFRAVSRALAPMAIRETAEFAGLCPASAVLMRKLLQP